MHKIEEPHKWALTFDRKCGNHRLTGMNGRFIVAIVFGIVMSGVLLCQGRILSGCWLLGLSVFILAIRIARGMSSRLLTTTIAAAVCCCCIGYSATRSEITGKAVYYYSSGRSVYGEPVVRVNSPEKFREATNLKWGLALVMAGIGAAVFTGYRKLNSSDLFD